MNGLSHSHTPGRPVVKLSRQFIHKFSHPGDGGRRSPETIGREPAEGARRRTKPPEAKARPGTTCFLSMFASVLCAPDCATLRPRPSANTIDNPPRSDFPSTIADTEKIGKSDSDELSKRSLIYKKVTHFSVIDSSVIWVLQTSFKSSSQILCGSRKKSVKQTPESSQDDRLSAQKRNSFFGDRLKCHSDTTDFLQIDLTRLRIQKKSVNQICLSVYQTRAVCPLLRVHITIDYLQKIKSFFGEIDSSVIRIHLTSCKSGLQTRLRIQKKNFTFGK